ncbi:MAG: HD domain-containing protein [Lachnospiraceae bacterium]|nr:HD domain-containing protein [Lachnospiraceae bacterium]
MKSSKSGIYPNINSLYSTIPRDIRMHMYRVSKYGQAFLERVYREEVLPNLPPEEILEFSEAIFRLHDIGRYYIPMEIYNKVTKLTEEEVKEIKNHTIYALQAEKSVYFPFFPEQIMPHFRDVAVYHHERWNGTGYPEGLKGEKIPCMARMCAIVDTYDGMTSWKPYRESMNSEKAMKEIKALSGKLFQPKLVECFQRCKNEIELLDIKMNGKQIQDTKDADRSIT